MKINKLSWVLPLLFCAVGSSSAIFGQNLTFSGDLGSMWGFTAPGTKNSGDLSVGLTDFTGTIEAYSGNSSVFVEGTVISDSVLSSLDFELGEAYLDYSTAGWGFRAGRQKTVWGKADGVNITNSVFPKDESTLFADDTNLPFEAARFSVTGNSFTVDGLWIPFFEGNKLPLEKSNPLRAAVVPSSVNGLVVSVNDFSKPELKLKNGELGLKMSGYFSFCDLSVYGFYGFDKSPVLSYEVQMIGGNPCGIQVCGEYKRMGMAGFDAAFPIKATVLRLESAVFPERSFQTKQDYAFTKGKYSIKQNQIMALAGIDWMPDVWTITVQYYCDAILNKSDNLQREKDFLHNATFNVSRTFLSETLEISVSGLVGLNYFDSACELQGVYSLCDEIKLKAGSYIFLAGPQKDGQYGSFKDLSTIYVKCEYKF